jgi:hypothetical protein
MPETIANVAKHSDITAEQVEYIEKQIEVVNKREAFWGKFCQDDRTPKADKIKYRHQVLVDPTAVNTLTEGVIPDPTKIKVQNFEASLITVGSYIRYTAENLVSVDNMVDLYGNQLAHERLYDLETLKSTAFFGTTNTVTFGTNWEKTFLLAKASVSKSKGKPVSNGKYACVAPVEVTNLIVEEAGEKLKGSEAGAKALADGYIGAFCGFDIYEHNGPEMYNDDGTALVLFFGRNEYGELPVKARSFSGENAEVISNGISSGDKNDPLNQFGTIGSKIIGVGAVLQSPEVVWKLTSTATEIEGKNDYDTNAETSPAA